MRKVKFNEGFVSTATHTGPFNNPTYAKECADIFNEFVGETLFELVSEDSFTAVLALESGKTFSIFTHHLDFI